MRNLFEEKRRTLLLLLLAVPAVILSSATYRVTSLAQTKSNTSVEAEIEAQGQRLTASDPEDRHSSGEKAPGKPGCREAPANGQ